MAVHNKYVLVERLYHCVELSCRVICNLIDANKSRRTHLKRVYLRIK